MISLFDLNPFDLKNLSLKDYFKKIEFALGKNNTVDKLTGFFTEQPFSEYESYMNRRLLKPIDTRFEKIELVYESGNFVRAIVWDLSISLSQLTAIFGTPIMHTEPYSDTTAFAFKSANPNIDIIKTRYPEWLRKLKNKDVFEYDQENNQRVEVENPMFSFIQISLMH